MPETESQAQPQDFTPRQRLISGAVTIAVLALMVYGAVGLTRDGLRLRDLPLSLRLSLFALSGLFMLTAATWIFTLLRRKHKTGKFQLSGAEAAEQRAAALSKVGPGKPLGPQAMYWAVPLILSAVLVSFAIPLLAFATCSCSDPSWRRIRILLLLGAATLLVIPAMLLYKLIRRKLKTGSFLVSREELAEMQARCAKPLPMWQRIFLPAIFYLDAIIFTSSALRHHHPGSSTFLSPWVLAALWWAMALTWTWRAFHPAKPLCALSVVPHETATPEPQS